MLAICTAFFARRRLSTFDCLEPLTLYVFCAHGPQEMPDVDQSAFVVLEDSVDEGVRPFFTPLPSDLQKYIFNVLQWNDFSVRVSTGSSVLSCLISECLAELLIADWPSYEIILISLQHGCCRTNAGFHSIRHASTVTHRIHLQDLGMNPSSRRFAVHTVACTEP